MAKAITPKQYDRIVDALEAGTITTELQSQELFNGKNRPGRTAVAVAFYTAELQLGLAKPIAATPRSVKAARNTAKLRWRKIAVYAGITEAQARELYAKSGGDADTSYIGVGRKPVGLSQTAE